MPSFSLLLRVGRFSKSGSLSTVLRPHGVDVTRLVEDLNQEFSDRGYPVNTKVQVTYTQNAFGSGYVINRTMFSSEILNEIGLSSGSSSPTVIVGDIAAHRLLRLARIRLEEGLMGINTSLEGAWRQACGLCHSLGVTVGGQVARGCLELPNE